MLSVLPAGYKLGDFTILATLGQGGFGVTYLAEDKTLGRRVAIKEYFPSQWSVRETNQVSVTPNPSTADDYAWGLDRFLKEARTLARFHHPAIVSVNRIFQGNGTAYMVLNYEDGDSLKAWLAARQGPPSQTEFDRIVPPLLEALALIHNEGVLHRDIAPDNIFIRKNGTPVLLDFGAAREAIGHHSKSISAIVKEGFSPLEQYSSASKAQGAWTDIYAMGATLYRALTGTNPPPATERATGAELGPIGHLSTQGYRPGFLQGIEASLALITTDRPQSVDDWKAMLMGHGQAAGAAPIAHTPATQTPTLPPVSPGLAPPTGAMPPHAASTRASRWPGIALAVAVVIAIAGGGWWFTNYAPEATVPEQLAGPTGIEAFDAFGMTLVPLNDRLRSENGVGQDINGFYVSEVAFDGEAVDVGIQAGSVISIRHWPDFQTADEFNGEVQRQRRLERRFLSLWETRPDGDRRAVEIPLSKAVAPAPQPAQDTPVPPARENFVSIGTGGVTGVFYPTGGAICRMLNRDRDDHGIACSVESTGGSIANINAIRNGELQFGIAQSDWQFHAYNGTSRFAEVGPFTKLRAVFSVYPEPMTVVARADAGIERFEDLRGKRVSVGNPGSGQRAMTELLMGAMGWTMNDFALAAELPWSEQHLALCNNRVDAMILTIGHPAARVQEATRACDTVLVEVSNAAVDRLVAGQPFLRRAVIPGGMYRGTDQGTATFGVGATLVTSADVSEGAVYRLVQSVFENLDAFKKLHPAFANLSAREMTRDSLSAPLHPGAERYFREAGLIN